MTSIDNSIVSLIQTSVDIELKEGVSLEELKKILADYINSLINTNFNKLISILYRMDINEPKLVRQLQENPGVDAGLMLAEMIIERQKQKIKSRAFYNKKDSDADENEKW